MASADENKALRIGFVEDAQENRLTIIRLYDLAGVLTAFQRSIYATAAFALERPGLTREQRREFTWGITAIREGSFWTDLIPVIYSGVTQGALFADSIGDIWQTTKLALLSFSGNFSHKKPATPLEERNFPYAVEFAEASLRSDKNVESASLLTPR